MKKLFLMIVFAAAYLQCIAQAGLKPIVAKQYVSGSIAMIANGKSPNIIISDNDWQGVKRASKDLQEDIKMVTGQQVSVLTDQPSPAAIIIGTIGKSKLEGN